MGHSRKPPALLAIIFLLASIALLVVYFLGLYYLTNRVFSSNLSHGRVVLHNLGPNQFTFIKMFLALIWISIILNLLFGYSTCSNMYKDEDD